MTFPDSPLAVTTELQIGGAWVDVSGDVYLRDRINITRGRQNEGSQVDPGACSLTLNNRDGKYSPRNPLSPYYGQIGRNTPLRVSVHTGAPYLRIDTLGDRAATLDDPALDITGDLDIRLDVTLDDWTGAAPIDLAARWGLAPNLAWRLMLFNYGRLDFAWSMDGTNTKEYASSVPVTVPPSGRLAVRVTLDVNDGAGNHVMTFWTAPSLDGPWTQLGDTRTGAGGNSVYASTSPLQVGDITNNVSYPPAAGQYHALELRNGINGAVVANPVFTAQAPGTSSFTDSAGRVWTLAGNAEITDRRIRFLGEVSAWPSRWDVSGKDVWVPIEAAGIRRRLGQGAKSLASTLRRRIPSYSPLAYWPMEEDRDATQAYSPIEGVRPAQVTGLDFGADDTLAGSSSLPTLSDAARLTAQVPPAASGAWQIEFVYRIDTAPAGDANAQFFRFKTTGTGQTWRIGVGASGIHFDVTDADGTTLDGYVVTPPTDFFGRWNRLHIEAKQNGSNVNWSAWWITIGGGTLGTGARSFTGSCGRVVSIATTYAASLQGMVVGHLGVFDKVDSTIYNYADHGFNNELTVDRMRRLCSEEGVPLRDVGYVGDTAPLGPQRPNALLDLLEESADADGGILAEARDQLALRYRPRETLYNQPVTLALDYTAPGLAPPLEPVEDDQGTRNDVTVKRTGGSSARAVQETGPLSVQAPPDGVGIYDESVTLNLYSDGQTAPIAGWRLHLGTWDAPRYPRVRANLAAAPNLVPDATAVDSGDRLTIANPPAWLPPGTIDLLVQGYSETLGVYDWDLEFNCSPAGPWTVAVADDPVLARADTDGSELAAAATATDTVLQVTTTSGPVWTTDPQEFPVDVLVGGEVVTATAITPAAGDRFDRTVTSGWGTADSGQAWTTTGGSTSDYSVQGV